MKNVLLTVLFSSLVFSANAQVSLVKQINPVLGAGSFPGTGVVHNNISYFLATDTMHGTELWRSDGTESGTYLLIDLYPGPNSFSWYERFIWGDDLYFFVYNSSTFFLWKFNTLTEQATLIKNFDRSGILGARFGEFTVVGDLLYFIATDSQTGDEIWKTDGTPTGTTILKDIVPGSLVPTVPFSLRAFNGKLYFFTEYDNGFWESDGSAENTIKLNDTWPSSEISLDVVDILVPVQHGFFFTPFTSMYGHELWFSDGTTAGTHLVKDIDTVTNNIPTVRFISLFRSYGVLGNRLVFATGPGLLAQIWISDGTEAGTSMIYEIDDPGGNFFAGFTELNGILIFKGYDKEHGNELWRTDGTPDGTYLVKDLNAGTSPGMNSGGNLMTVLGDRAYFTTYPIPNYGSELWSTDGTEAGTRLEADMIPGTQSSNPTSMTPLGDCLLFSGSDTVQTKELFVFKPVPTSLNEPYVEDQSPRLWPNPADNYFYFEIDKLTVSPQAIQLRNQLGQVVRTIVNPAKGQRVDCSGLPAGLYVVEFQMPNSKILQQNLVLIPR